MNPLVSIVVLARFDNGALQTAVQSALDQDYEHLEVIIAGGAYAEGTLDWLSSTHLRDARLRLLPDAPAGLAQALNSALTEVRGTLVGWLDSSHWYTTGSVRRAVEEFRSHPNWLMLYGEAAVVSPDGGSTTRFRSRRPGAPMSQFNDGHFLCASTVFYRRTLSVLLGKLNEQLQVAFDLDYLMRALAAFSGRIGFVDSVQAQTKVVSSTLWSLAGPDGVLEAMRVAAEHLGHASGRWLLDYVDDLVSRPHPPESGSLRERINAAVDAGAQWMRPADVSALRTVLASDKRIDWASLASPVDNQALGMEEFAAGVVRVRSTPRVLTLETTSRCNLRCVMCPHAIDAVHRPKHLDESLIEKMERFIHQAAHIQLHGIGEPLASPAFWSTLQYLPDHSQCESSINTNLTVLDDQRLARLLESNLRIINVSLDAATPQTYWKIRGFEFDTVVANLRRLLEARVSRGTRSPLVYMNMTMMRSNIEEVPAFVELAASLGADAVYLWHLNRWSDTEMARYVVRRDDWVFDYAREGLWNFPAMSNDYINQGVALAKRLGVELQLDHNKSVFFEGQEDGNS